MTVYVDPLMFRGWKLHGSEIKSCHLFTDSANLQELHTIAKSIGLQRAWFQDSPRVPHYDLTPARRQAAIDSGAVPVRSTAAARIWKTRRERIAAAIARAAEEILEKRPARRARRASHA